ncbi:MAG: hypothetical protein AAGD07_22955 [Planctomycetota bacterium]
MLIVIMVIAGVIGVSVLVGTAVIVSRKRAQVRREELSEKAKDLGMEFRVDGDTRLQEELNPLGFFQTGHSKKLTNLMQAETEIASMHAFDYAYTTGSGKNQTHHTHSVLAISSDQVALPPFQMRPEGFFDRVGAKLGMQDIDFESHPRFSELFVLKSVDDEGTRRFFDAKLLTEFESREGLRLEAERNWFVYIKPHMLPPVQIREFIDEGFRLFQLFADRVDRDAGQA